MVGERIAFNSAGIQSEYFVRDREEFAKVLQIELLN